MATSLRYREQFGDRASGASGNVSDFWLKNMNTALAGAASPLTRIMGIPMFEVGQRALYNKKYADLIKSQMYLDALRQKQRARRRAPYRGIRWRMR